MESGFGHVQAVRRSEPNRPALVGQKEEARNQIEVQQLVAKVQWDLPFVSIFVIPNQLLSKKNYNYP